jgi:hypothetical protein
MAKTSAAQAPATRNPNPGNSTKGRGTKPAPAKASGKAAAAKKQQASKATTARPTKVTKVAAGRHPQTKEQRAARGTMIQGAGEPTPEEAFRQGPVSLRLTSAGKLVSADAGGSGHDGQDDAMVLSTLPDPRSLAGQLNRQLGDNGMRRVTTAIVVHPIVHEFYKRMAGLRAIKGQQAPSDAGVLRPYSVSALIREALIAHIPGYHQELLANGIDVAKEWQARYPDANLEEILGKL